MESGAGLQILATEKEGKKRNVKISLSCYIELTSIFLLA